MHSRHSLWLRWVIMLAAYVLFGLTIDMQIAANLGVAPWDVLHLGTSGQLGISLGWASFIIGALVVLAGWALGMAPTLGTVANVVVISLSVDFFRNHGLVPVAATLPGRLAMLVASTFVMAQMTALYTSLGLGAGPRDGLMLGLTGRVRLPVGLVRIVIEVGVVATGWLIGGPVGLGTVLVAVLLGPFVQIGYRLVAWVARGRAAAVLVPPVRLPVKEAAQGG